MDDLNLETVDRTLMWVYGGYQEDNVVRDLNLMLYRAVNSNYYYIVKGILDHNDLNVNIRVEGFAPIHRAILNGNRRMVQLLLDHGADINWNRGFYLTSYIKYCSFGMIKFLFERGFRYTHKSYVLWVKLCELNSVEKIDYIFMMGTRLYETYKSGVTPSDYRYGHKLYSILIEKENKDLKPSKYFTVLKRLQRWILFHRKQRYRALIVIQRWYKECLYKPEGSRYYELKRKHPSIGSLPKKKTKISI